jgi:hypothetical protein
LRWLAATAVLLLILLLPFRIPYSIKTLGKIQPRREWFVVRASDGQISTHLVNHEAGLVEKVTVTQMQRGDAAEFRLLPVLLHSDTVTEGDTVAILHSADLEQAITQVKGSLAAARAQLMVLSTGEKWPLVEEAQHRVEQAMLAAEEQGRVAERLSALYDRQLVSFQEYELALATQRVYEANINMAKSQLASMQSGAKKEASDLVLSQITSLEQEIVILQKKASGYVLRSPLSGIRIQYFSPDTFLAVAETSSYTLTMPIRAREHSILQGGESVCIQSANGAIRGIGHLFFINPMLELLNGEQIFWAVARIDESEGLFPGMFLPSEIKCKAISKFTYLHKFME